MSRAQIMSALLAAGVTILVLRFVPPARQFALGQ